jgi:programmed cell death 6-interacting protein
MAKNFAESDDIEPRISREALGVERWTEVKASMFEDTLDEELQKFQKFKENLEDNASQQEDILRQIEVGTFSGWLKVISLTWT